MLSSSLAMIGYSGPTLAVIDLWLFAVGLARGSIGVFAWLVLPIALGSLAVWVRRRFFTPAPRHAADPHAAPAFVSGEAETMQWRLPRPLAAGKLYIGQAAPLRQEIIREYDASRTTVMRLKPDKEMLERVFQVARSIGRNDRRQLEDHEPLVSRDLDINRCGPLRIVTNSDGKDQLETPMAE